MLGLSRFRLLALSVVPAVIAGVALSTPSFAITIAQTQSAYGWGRNLTQGLCNYGPSGTNDQVQNGDQRVPVYGLGGSVQQMAGGSGFVLYLMSNGTVLGCGKDSFNALGDGNGDGFGGQFENTPHAAVFPSGTVITQVAAGDDTGYALDNAGHVWSWGSRFLGQTGDGVVGSNCCDRGVPYPEQILSNMKAIAAAGAFAMALDNNGHVWTWGANEAGQLGQATGGSPGNVNATPTEVVNTDNTGLLSNVISISAGGHGFGSADHALAVVADDPAHPELGGQVWAWGGDENGELGDEATTNRNTPQLAHHQPFGSVATHSATQVVAGAGVSFVITTEHDVYGWGADTNGILGNGAAGPSNTPVELSFPLGVNDLKASTDAAMALLSDGTIATWGVAQLFGAAVPSPVVQNSPVAVTSIGMGFDTYLAVAKDPTAVTVSPSSATIPKGLHQQLTATATYANSSTADVTHMATWSSAPGFATVDQNGLVTGSAVGSSTVSATVAGTNGSSAITVDPPAPDHLVVQPAEATAPVGESGVLHATEVFSDNSTGTPSSASWSSDNLSAVTVDASTGTATAVGLGDATLTATADGVHGTSLIHVSPVSSLSIIPLNKTILPAEHALYKVTATFDNGASQPVSNATFSSTQPSVATVTNTQGAGDATGQSVGSTVITASLEGKTATSSLHVANVTSITVSPSPVHLAPGTGRALSAAAHLSDGTTRNVTSTATWTSSAPGKAPVAANGFVYGNAPGTATIRATFGGVTGTATVSVSHVSSITVAPSSFTMVTYGGKRQLTATGHLADGSTQDLTSYATWSSSDSESVPVDRGLVINDYSGSETVTINAAYDSQTGTATAHINTNGGEV